MGAHALLDIFEVFLRRDTADECLSVLDLYADLRDNDVDDEQRDERSEKHICAETNRTAENIREELREIFREKVKADYRNRREHKHDAVEGDVAGVAVLRASHREHNEADEDEHCRKQNRHKRYEIEQESVAEEARADILEQRVKIER